MTVSLEAIFLALFVLASQNRLARQSDMRAHLNLQVDLLAEREMTAVLRLLLDLTAHLGVTTSVTRDQVHDLAKKTDLDLLTRRMDRWSRPSPPRSHIARHRQETTPALRWMRNRPVDTRMERAVHQHGQPAAAPTRLEETIMTDPRKVQTLDRCDDIATRLAELLLPADMASLGYAAAGDDAPDDVAADDDDEDDDDEDATTTRKTTRTRTTTKTKGRRQGRPGRRAGVTAAR